MEKFIITVQDAFNESCHIERKDWTFDNLEDARAASREFDAELAEANRRGDDSVLTVEMVFVNDDGEEEEWDTVFVRAYGAVARGLVDPSTEWRGSCWIARLIDCGMLDPKTDIEVVF